MRPLSAIQALGDNWGLLFVKSVYLHLPEYTFSYRVSMNFLKTPSFFSNNQLRHKNRTLLLWPQRLLHSVDPFLTSL